jgi:hypothetical protein
VGTRLGAGRGVDAEHPFRKSATRDEKNNNFFMRVSLEFAYYREI